MKEFVWFPILLLLTTTFSVFANNLSITQPANIAPLAEKKLLTDLVSITEDNIIFVGERGHILSYKNKTVTQKEAPVNSLLTQVFFYSEQHGWAVGHDATILYTMDGGESWEVQQYEPSIEKPLFDIHFFDSLHGIAIGAYGLFFRTNDAGKTWQEEFHSELLSLDDQEYLAELKASDPEGYLDEKSAILPHFNRLLSLEKEIHLVGETGLYAISQDFGKTWQKQDEFYYGSLFDIEALDQQTLICVGLRGNVFRSTDTGKSWQKITLQTTNTINGITWDKKQKQLFLLGNGGELQVSTDFGKNFQSVIQKDGKILLQGIMTEEGLLTASEVGIKLIAYH